LFYLSLQFDFYLLILLNSFVLVLKFFFEDFDLIIFCVETDFFNFSISTPFILISDKYLANSYDGYVGPVGWKEEDPLFRALVCISYISI
jgi:hypothetical protein